MHANEEKYIDKIFKERSKLKAKTSEQKPKTDDDMAKIIQRHWRGHSQRRFQAIGRKKKFEVGKGITLWRTFRFITIHKYDKMLGREMYLLTVLLSPDETHILIKANSREKKDADQITLKIYVKELVDYFDIDTLDETSNIFKSTEKINSIKNFTSCFLDSLYIEDKTLKFNQRKKLQKLIELLNEDSVLNLEDTDEAANKEGDPFSIQSTVELALRKNNYEQYLDMITTRVQKRVKGFLARKAFALKRDLESIKVLEIELNQDGEDLLFIVMKRIKTGELTGFCYNFSVSQKFQPTFITKPKMGISSSESSMLKRLFQKTYFELDKNAIHYEDFYLREESMERNMGLMIPTDQLIKVEHYIQKYSAKHDGDFHPRGFSMPNRYQLQGKRFLVYKGTPMIILVFYKLFQIFTSVESKIMRIDCLRQDTRQFIHSKVFHCEGEQIGILSQGKRLFDGFKLRGAIGSSLEIVFASTDMEEIDSDIDAKKYEIICSIQRHFKSIKLKESFECCIEGDDSVYQIEIYYLKATEKILIKISENTKEDSIRAPTDKLYSITKPKISNRGPELKIIQMLVLNFSEIYHPDDELTDEQVEKLVNVIIFEKLNKSERFFVDQITPQDMARVMKAEIGAKLANKQEWIEEMVSSDKFPNERTAFSELNRELRSDHEDRTHEFSRAADSPRGDDDNEVASTLMPNLRWEFDFNYNSHQQLHDEENEAISSGGSMSREGGFMQKDLFSTTRNLLKTIQPTKIEEFPVLSKHKTMKHKLLALYKFNSIRKQGVRKTSPIISPNRTQDLDIEVGNKEDEANKDRISHQNKRRLTRHGLTLDLIVTNHEDELDQNQKHTHTSNTKQKTIISQAAAASIKSKNVDQTSGAMYRSEYRIRDSPQISKRSGKYRRSMIQAHKSRVEKSHLDPERVETESKSSRKTSRIHVIKKLNSAVSNASGPDPTEDLKTAKMIDVNTFASPGLDSIPKFFRNTQIIEEDHPEDNFNKKSLFKLHTVKKESSQSIVEHNSASQPRSRLPSISLNESDFKVPVLEAPISKRPNTRNSSKKMTVLRMLPNEQMPSSNSFRRDSIDMPKHSSTLRSSKRALD